MDYRGHHWKYYIKIFESTQVNLQQKCLFQWNYIYFLKTVEGGKNKQSS